ncbi:thiol-disulfide oxidoreductase DCC family protein [Pseudoalteromonas sp. SSDWG2]|uniref:thiol-disulfide oxidoreductase DCC family protein n=1 Tax=Pseudoalteromonas sp. SSDWG2 TaxID=3139391 RepID=UPI003BAAD2CA
MLTLFYDGACPLCNAEITKLKSYDSEQRITFVDINNERDFIYYPQVSFEQAFDTLHAIDCDGRILLGLDANIAAWNAVGKYRWLNVLRLPVLRLISDACYRLFAKHRVWISNKLMGCRCNQQCKVGSKDG